MADFLNSIILTRSLIDSNVALKLLRTRNLSLILTFFHREFKGGQELAISYQKVVSSLADYLEEIDYSEEDDEVASSRLIMDYHERAKLYIDRWIDAYYIRNFIDDTTKEPLVMLSKHVEKVFRVFDVLKEKEFIGTESKFKDIFNKLRDLIENANPDKEKRLADLEKRKQAIEEEIRRINIDGQVSIYEDYQIKSRFEDVNRLANELIGDFKEVEDNFKDITRKIYEKQQGQELTKGKLLSETFDSLYELKNTDQGKSFYAFWQFMLDDMGQEELQRLTKDVHKILSDREIELSSRSLKKLKTLLHQAGRKVLEKNDLLADKLSREIVSKDQQESRKSKELMAAIRKLALKNAGKNQSKEEYFTIDSWPEIHLPLERKLGEKSLSTQFISRPNIGTMDLNDLSELAKIYSNDMVDKKLLLANINDLLRDKGQVTLKQVIEAKGISKGLAELLAYISLLNHSSKFFVKQGHTEIILFDSENGKYLETPQIVFSK